MKKLFLIPLLACFSCVMAWAAEVEVATISELRNAINNAANGDVIKLTADIDYGQVDYADNLNITKSITLDGQGHTLKGGGKRDSGSGQYATVWVNLNGSNDIDITFKDIKIINGTSRSGQADMAIQTRNKLHSLTLQNVYLEAPSVPLQIGGNLSGLDYTPNITIESSHLHALTYYPLLSWNKYNLVANNTKFEGWCSLYFKGVSNSTGSRGSVIVANNCQFNAPNVHSGISNAFGMFVCEDDGISITLNNCSMDAEQLGDQSQAVLVLSSNAAAGRRTEAVSLTVNGDNSYINGKWVDNYWPIKVYGLGTDEHGNKILGGCYTDGSFFLENPETGNYDGEFVFKSPQYAPSAYTAPINLTFTGGTYSQNPESATLFPIGITPVEAEDEPGVIQYGAATIPATHEVKTIETQQGDQTTTLYRVRKKITTSYTINQDVEGVGEGQNENTEFIIQANETVNVPTDAVIANYVEVSNNATLTIPDGTQLEVTNGLDVTDGATVVIEAGSTVIVGEGGVTSEEPSSIVITADENGSASFLLDPEVIVNTTPNITVKMTAKGVGYESYGGDDYYYWFRFSAPVKGITELGKDKDRPTYIYKWDYAANDWNSISALSELTPFQGYSLTTDHVGLEDVTYTFEGQLAGNQDMMLNFQSRGFNYFGNSYTGYLDVHALVDQLMAHEYIDGTVYLWNNTDQVFYPVTLGDLAASDPAEVAPMQTFILRQINSGEPTSTELNYESAIWGNPRYGRVSAPVPAPRRAAANNTARMSIVVTAANGQKDNITLKEDETFTNEFDKGFDAVKFMNERTINLYSTIDGENYGIVASDDLEGTTLSFQTNNELAYTLSFANVRGNEYAIRDNVTGAVVAIEEGATYEFAAQPNSIVEGRFEIIPLAEVPTAIENTEVKANVKGIYTIMGQYLGEDFDILPAGVYVVNGVKIVK